MLRSDAVTQGIQRSPNRAMLRVGFGDEDGKPILGMPTATAQSPPATSLDDLSKQMLSKQPVQRRHASDVRDHRRRDGISMGTEGMKYSLVSREVIADAIETACNGQSMDGVLAVGGCDKNMPGAMLATRMNIPSIFVYGGTIKPSWAAVI